MFGVDRWGWNQVLIERNEPLAVPIFQIRVIWRRCSPKDDLYDGLGIEEVCAGWIGGVDSVHPHCGRGGERYVCFIESVVKIVIHHSCWSWLMIEDPRGGKECHSSFMLEQFHRLPDRLKSLGVMYYFLQQRVIPQGQ